jgi:uncharacterized phiE125 gp8 family phage protein
MNPRVISEPTVEVVSLDTARRHLNLDNDGNSPPAHEDDLLIEIYLRAARQSVEKYTERVLVPTGLEYAVDRFPCGALKLPGAPLREVTGITYIDRDEVEQTLDPGAYSVDAYSEPGWLLVKAGTAWPSAACVVNAVKIQYTAGYDGPDSVDEHPLPSPLQSAVLLTLGHLYENRESVVVGTSAVELPLAVKFLLQPYRLHVGL